MMYMLLDHVKDAHGYIMNAMDANEKGMKDVCAWNLDHAKARIDMFNRDSADLLKFKSHEMTEEAIACLAECLNAHAEMAQNMLAWAKEFCAHVK